MEDDWIKIKKHVRFCFFFWFFKNCELIKDSSLWRLNFIPLVCDSIIIMGSRSVTYTFGSHFAYKRWVRVFYQNRNFSFLGQVFQYFCWVSKRVDWDSQHIPIFLLGLKAYLLRFASFGIRAQVLKSVFYPFYLLFPVIIIYIYI